jgi:hypothetical protein
MLCRRGWDRLTYATVVEEMIAQLPEVRAFDSGSFDENSELAYVIFGDHLRPTLETALKSGDLKLILRICAFLEEVAISGKNDGMLHDLLAIEIGEWLRDTPYEVEITPWLGAETMRICDYVPGLAAQRLRLKSEATEHRFGARLSKLWQKFVRKRSNAD